MRQLRRTLAFLLMACTGVALASAETILVYVDHEGRSGDLAELALPTLLELESGIMDVFFETGHIVFNSPIGRLDAGLSPLQRSQALRGIASDGGAAYSMEVVVELTIDTARQTARIQAADFRFARVEVPELLASDTLSAGNDTRGRPESPRAFGRRLAEAALAARR